MSAPTHCYEAQLEILNAIIVRQTNYTHEEAANKLLEHHNDVQAIVREYMTGSAVAATTSSSATTVNQQIYKEIRTMMDDAAKTYKSSSK